MSRFTAPLDGTIVITGEYGPRNPARKSHTGTDLRARTPTPFYASAPGTVVGIRTGWKSATRKGTVQGRNLFPSPGAGNWIVVDYGPVLVVYAHASSISLRPGARVSHRTQLGLTGATGGVPAHLHVGCNHPATLVQLDPATCFDFTKPNNYTPPTTAARAVRKDDAMRLIQNDTGIYFWNGSKLRGISSDSHAKILKRIIAADTGIQLTTAEFNAVKGYFA